MMAFIKTIIPKSRTRAKGNRFPIITRKGVKQRKYKKSKANIFIRDHKVKSFFTDFTIRIRKINTGIAKKGEVKVNASKARPAMTINNIFTTV
jgi:hypothetical protein